MVNSRKISDLTPAAQVKCNEFVAACANRNITVKIIQTLRDAEYQASLYAQGRNGDKRPQVTKCDGYKLKSNHQSGNAWDAVPLDADGNIDWKAEKTFAQMALVAKGLGIKAGYYWKMHDSPHFELA